MKDIILIIAIISLFWSFFWMFISIAADIEPPTTKKIIIWIILGGPIVIVVSLLMFTCKFISDFIVKTKFVQWLNKP